MLRGEVSAGHAAQGSPGWERRAKPRPRAGEWERAPSPGLLHLHRSTAQLGRGCRTSPEGLRTLLQSQPESTRRSWPRRTRHRLLRLSGIQATRSCSDLRSQFISNCKASDSHARPDCPQCSSLPKHRLLPPTISDRLAGDPPAPRGRLPWRLPCALCVRPATRAELSFPRCHG
jgi:hypothetical protein